MTDSREDLLRCRALGRTATPSDWSELDARAAADPELWHRLAHDLRLEGSLARAVAGATATADAIGLPTPAAARLRVPASAGWLAAGLVAAAWCCSALVPAGAPPALLDAGPAALTRAPVDPAALRLVSGEIVGELPKVLIESLPGPGGRGVQLVYLRQTFERVQVDSFVQETVDEYGAPSSAALPMPIPLITENL